MGSAGGPPAAPGPATATLVIVAFSAAIYVIYRRVPRHRRGSFAWSGTIGTLILLVAYVLATIGCIILLFVRQLPVPMWQFVVPLLALVVLGYTLYRNVIPIRRPARGAGSRSWPGSGWWSRWSRFVAPGFTQRLGAALTASEGIGEPAGAEGGSRPGTRRAPPQA